MSLKTKRRFKNIGKTIGIALFALLMFTNIKIALMDDTDLASGDISLLGIEMNLFEGTYAEDYGGFYGYPDMHDVDYICIKQYGDQFLFGFETRCAFDGDYCISEPCF